MTASRETILPWFRIVNIYSHISPDDWHLLQITVDAGDTRLRLNLLRVMIQPTPAEPLTLPADRELIRELCERILRQNWREGTMPDGTPFAYTSRNLGQQLHRDL